MTSNMLGEFAFQRMTVTPRPSAAQGQQTAAEIDAKLSSQLFAAVTAAHPQLGEHDGAGAFAVSWDRTGRGADIRVLVGGRPFSPVAHGDSLLYPPGSRGHVVDTGELMRDWAELVWVRCVGRPDALWTLSGDTSAAAPGRAGFDDYVTHLPGAFAWLVVATPVPHGALDEAIMRLQLDITDHRGSPTFEPARLAVARGEARHRELSRAMPTGVWNIHVLVGAPDSLRARAAAGLLCSASDLDRMPYTLMPDRAGAAADLDQAWVNTIEAGEAEFASPFIGTAELVATLARPPRKELPGIRVVEPAVFDVTPEHHGHIEIGSVLDATDNPVGGFTVTRNTLNRHTFVAGATGSGKSQTVRRILDGLHADDIPWLVIEPAKAEYAGMAGRIGEAVTVIRPGAPDAVPAGINPLEPAAGFPLQTHIDLTRALFLAAFDAVEPFPQVLSHALDRCYTDLGWNPVLSASTKPGVTPRYPRLSDLQTTALAVVDGIGYSREITDNVRGFIDVRIGSLRLGTPGRFFEGAAALDVAALLSGNTVLEIEDVGNDADKAFFIGAVLIRIYEHLRTHPADRPGLRHVTVIEEAHRLLRRAEPGTPSAHAVELFTALLAEIRAYGEGLIVAEQIPAKISPDVVKNTALKILHRLPAAEDRDTVGATMNLDDAQSRHVVSLPPGQAAVFADGMDRPARVAVDYRESVERRDDRAPATLAADTMVLRDLDTAHRLARDPRLIVWIELLIIAKLVGRQPPAPSKVWLHELSRGKDPNIVQEAVFHRIRTGVDARYAGLATHYQPEHLVALLAATAQAWLNGVEPDADDNPAQWQAGRFRWADIEAALRVGPPSESPHPHTSMWRARGIDLPGPSTLEQLEQLRSHPDSWAPDPAVVAGLALAAAVAKLSNHTDPLRQLRQATAHVHLDGPWPLAVLERSVLP